MTANHLLALTESNVLFGSTTGMIDSSVSNKNTVIVSGYNSSNGDGGEIDPELDCYAKCGDEGKVVCATPLSTSN